jgi:hypothetical protein
MMIMSRKKANSLLIMGGVVAIVVMFLIFVPAILGATASQNDLEKYNGSSNQGNETVRISGVVNTFFVGITGIPLVIAAMLTALAVVMVAVLMLARKK